MSLLLSRIVRLTSVVLLSFGLAGSAAACSTSAATPGATPTTAGTIPPGTIMGTTPCPAADGSSPREVVFDSGPPKCIDLDKTYIAHMDTSRGPITITLDPKLAPLAVNNFVVLSRYHFYDGLVFDRNIAGYVIGAGRQPPPLPDNPGYAFKDELPTDRAAYQPGTFMMDNAGPDTNGSKWMIMVQNQGIAPKFTVMGQVTEGLDTTVAAIDKTGSSNGQPTAATTIEKITITER